MVGDRPTWDLYMMHIARAVSERADCTRRKVGAVIMDTEHRIVSTGYNGAPSGMPGCLTDGACERGRHQMKDCGCGMNNLCVCAPYCVCGCEWPCKYDVEPGSSYDTGPGSCIAVHAEANALLYARRSLVGCTMYVNAQPCEGCLRLIHAAKLADVVYRHTLGRIYAYDCETRVESEIR
jgi:dCMP deaminase